MAKTKNSGAANLMPGNRKGVTGVRKKITKTILQSIGEFIEDEMPEHFATIQQMREDNPVEYVKAFQGLLKLYMPKMVQADITMNGGAGAGPPIVNINFGKQKIEVAELPQNPEAVKVSQVSEAAEETKFLPPASDGFILHLPIYIPENNSIKEEESPIN